MEEEKTNVVMFPGVQITDEPLILNVLTAAISLSIMANEFEQKANSGHDDSRANKMAAAIVQSIQKLLAECPDTYIELTHGLGIVVTDSSEMEYDEDE